jgi:hypothetical protein
MRLLTAGIDRETFPLRLREPTDGALVPVVIAVGAAIFVAFIVANLSAPIWLLFLASVFLAGILVVGWLFIRIGVYVGQGGLHVVNAFRSSTVAWQDIAKFGIGFPEARLWTWSPVLETVSGERVQMMGIQAPQPWTRPKNDYAARTVALLERLLSDARINSGEITLQALQEATLSVRDGPT